MYNIYIEDKINKEKKEKEKQAKKEALLKKRHKSKI